MDTEPLIHSHNTDKLPEDHPWVRKTVYCGRCSIMVHAFNNECMMPWVELSERALCMDCFQLMDCPTEPDKFVVAAESFPCTNAD